MVIEAAAQKAGKMYGVFCGNFCKMATDPLFAEAGWQVEIVMDQFFWYVGE